MATIGPSSENEEMLEKLILAGVDVARLNFSHGSHEEHGKRISTIRKLEKKLGKQIAILADMQGPKIRVGSMPKEGFELKNGEKVLLDTSKKDFENGIIPIDSEIFRDGTKQGHIVFLDDGTMQLKIISKKGDRFEALVVKGGTLFSRKGINVPSLDNNDASILSAKDRADMEFAVSQDVDYIALSFLRNPEDVQIARKLLKGATTKIIAKIERPEALVNLEEIIKVADVIMVARGDLGIETPLWELPLRQKEMVEKARKQIKPVIMATQMLDSMIRNPIATRAEVSDVANAVFDGTDCVMLSGESAQGKYPLEAVTMMTKVLEATEQEYDYGNVKEEISGDVLHSVARSATLIAKEVNAKAIIAGTVTGNSARAISHFRPKTPIISIAQDEKVARELAMVWGVRTLVVKDKKIKTVEDLIDASVAMLKEQEFLKKGDKVVCVFGDKLGVMARTNTITVKTIL